jgi:hypothetical protein
MATDSYSHLWGPVNFDMDAQMSNAAAMVEVDCDFLTMEIEVPSGSSNESFGHELSLDDRRNSLSMMSVISDCDYAPSQSNVPERQPSYDFSSEVAPAEKNEDVPLPGLTELEKHYQETFKKLAKSMRRSDETRDVIKRQRKVSPSLSFDSFNAPDFFASPRLKQSEQSRKRLLTLINKDA